MRKSELGDPRQMHRTREALRLIERLRERQRDNDVSGEEAVATTVGKATVTESLLAPDEAMDPATQLWQSTTSAASDVASLEQANRSGDLMRALWARGCVERFVEQAPWLLTAVPRGTAVELEAQAHAVIARARVALDNAPKLSPAARDAAKRGDYSQWEADLAPWRAQTQSAANLKSTTNRDADKPAPVRQLGASLQSSASENLKSSASASLEPSAIQNLESSASENSTNLAASIAGTTNAATGSGTAAVENDEHQVATRGTVGAGSPLPYLELIQSLFGHHDVSSLRAHIGGSAAAASAALGAEAYAYGDAIAFASSPDLHTAAHEAAHAVQQRGGVAQSLHGDDSYEHHADLVADHVVRGVPVAALLDAAPRGGGATAVVQRKKTMGVVPSTRNEPELMHTTGSRWPVFAKTGLPYIIESRGGLPGFWLARAWIAAASDMTHVGKAMRSPQRARELLTEMGWVASKNLDFAAKNLTFTFFGGINYFQVGAEAAGATGLPPGREAIVERDRENTRALTVTLALDDATLAPKRPHAMTTSERQRALQAAAEFTDLPVDPVGHTFAMTEWKPPMLKTGNGVITIQLPRALCRALFGFDAYNEWLGDKDKHDHSSDLKTPKLKLDNYYNRPVPGRLTHHGDIVEDGEEIRFEVLVDWPHDYPSRQIYDVPPMVTPSKFGTVALLKCQWQFERIDGPSGGPAAKASIETQSTSLAEAMHRFRLAPGEDKAVFRVTCDARYDEYFAPASVTRDVVVLSEAAAMSQLKSKAFAGLGADNTDRGHNKWTGDVQPGFKPSPAAGSPDAIADPMASDRAAQRQRLHAVGTYLSGNSANAEAVEAIDREVARQERSEELIAGDQEKGCQPFQIRGTYLSRTEGLASGPLDLHGTAHVEFHQDSYPGDGPATTHRIRNDKVVVQIRDLSRRFEQNDFEFIGKGDSFDQALHDAFDKLALAYPKGMVSIEAEQIRGSALRQVNGKPGPDAELGPGTGKTIGFQRSTETTWKKIKETVWGPVASVGVNLGAIAIMVFVPGSSVVMAPLLIAYNSVPPIDRISTQSDRGTLTVGDFAMSSGEIALNLLPMVARAKPFTAGWFAVETANWGGRVALMGAGAVEMAQQLQATHVAALAQEYQQFLELQKTSLPSDPGLAAAEAHIRQKAAEVDGEISRQFWEQVKQNAIQIAAGTVIHNTSAKARAAIVQHLAKPRAAGAAVHVGETTSTSSDGDVAVLPQDSSAASPVPEGTKQIETSSQPIEDHRAAKNNPPDIAEDSRAVQKGDHRHGSHDSSRDAQPVNYRREDRASVAKQSAEKQAQAKPVDAHGESAPEFRVERHDLQISTSRRAKEWNIDVKVRLSNGKNHSIGTGTVMLDTEGLPVGGPEFYIEKETHIDGISGKVQVYDQGAKQSLTDIVLDEAIVRFKQEFGHEPWSLPGDLAFENKRNFQRELVRAIEDGATPKEAEQIAIRRISFGRSRIKRGYSEIVVTTDATAVVDLGEPFGKREVPTRVHVEARRGDL